MIRGPKTKLVLERYTSSKDSGGAITKTWSSVSTVKGVLTFGWADEPISMDKETLHLRYQFWVRHTNNFTPTTKDEFSETGSNFRYRVVYVDDILKQNKVWSIYLLQIR